MSNNQGDGYAVRRVRADALLPAQIEVVKRIFTTDDVVVADIQTDRREATDVIVNGVVRVGLRWRKANDRAKYVGQWTIRAEETDGQSEWTKIKAGHGHFMLYGFADADMTGLTDWWLIDLNVFRAAADGWFARCPKMPGKVRPRSGDESFFAMRLDHFNEYGKLVIKEWSSTPTGTT